MKKVGSFLLAGFFFFAALSLPAQSEDPSEIFLKAYMTAQQGEKLEHENEFKAALAKYRFAGSLIEQLRKSHPDWQPAIVDYRGRKVSEAILRVQDKASTQENLAARPGPLEPQSPPAEVTPVAPAPAPTAHPSVEIVAPRSNETSSEPTQTPNESVIRSATKELQSKVDGLQSELNKSRAQISAAEKEKGSLNGRLQETSAKLDKAQDDLKKSKAAEQKIHDQLADAQGSLKKIQSTGDVDSKAQEALKWEIAKLKKALAGVEEGQTAAEKERDEANAKATKADQQVVSVTKERDDAVARLKGEKDVEQRVETLVAENSDLKQKLTDAEKTIREVSEDKPKRQQELAEVKQQLEQLRQQLADSQQQNKDYEVTVASLRSQLDSASSQLEKVKLTGANPEESAKLTKENQMLRAIIVREREEEARRDQAKKLLLAEFDKLQIKSETLTQQIQLLAQPVTKLTTEELALLRQPVVAISDENSGAIKTSFTFAKKMNDSGKPGAVENAVKQGNAPPNSTAATNSSTSDPIANLAHEAKESFAHAKYRSAEKLYQEILTKNPNHLYSLCNLGVVYFRTGKLKAAELTLKKAVAIAPKDEFAHTTLGIVYYRQAKFDNALTELTKALAINPKSATAHNYLGITASQKGWQEAAEKEMLEAIADNPNYADAHFNLAVIYATAQPPAKELAKRHYAKATELGSDPDPSLEKLLH